MEQCQQILVHLSMAIWQCLRLYQRDGARGESRREEELGEEDIKLVYLVGIVLSGEDGRLRGVSPCEVVYGVEVRAVGCLGF